MFRTEYLKQKLIHKPGDKSSYSLRPDAWEAALTQPWLMLRSLSWSERMSWLTWIALIVLYRAQPRRQGQPAGLGILARSLGATPADRG